MSRYNVLRNCHFELFIIDFIDMSYLYLICNHENTKYLYQEFVQRTIIECRSALYKGIQSKTLYAHALIILASCGGGHPATLIPKPACQQFSQYRQKSKIRKFHRLLQHCSSYCQYLLFVPTIHSKLNKKLRLRFILNF